MKFTKSNFGWIFTCFALVVLLGIAIYLGVSGWFFKNDISYTTDLELGKTVTTDIKKNQASAVTLTLDGAYLPGERLPQIISVRNGDGEDNVYLRAKIYIYTGTNITMDMDIVETVNWTYNENDGYYYLNDTVLPNAKVTLCSHVIMGDGDFSGHTKYLLTVVFEALSVEEDVETIWGTNPLESV